MADAYKEREFIPVEGNPFGLVYKDAITENVEGSVNIHGITYPYRDFWAVANVYTPAGYDPEKSYPAVVVAHPNGGMKDQVAGNYAQRLAENGYMTIGCYEAAVNAPVRELLEIPGATHIQTYWKEEYVDQAMAKLVEFFGAHL